MKMIQPQKGYEVSDCMIDMSQMNISQYIESIASGCRNSYTSVHTHTHVTRTRYLLNHVDVRFSSRRIDRPGMRPCSVIKAKEGTQGAMVPLSISFSWGGFLSIQLECRFFFFFLTYKANRGAWLSYNCRAVGDHPP